MVKHKPPRDVDRYMAEYKMRTPFATPTRMNRLSPNQKHTHSTRRHDAHERSHLRHNPSEAFYHSEGRIDKNTRMKKTNEHQNQIQTNNYTHGMVSTTATT